MQGSPLGSWPEVERRVAKDRRVTVDRRSGNSAEGVSPEYSGPNRRACERRSGVDRRFQPLFT